MSDTASLVAREPETAAEWRAFGMAWMERARAAEARLRDAQREAFVAGAEWEGMMSSNVGRTRFYGQAAAEAARRWP